MCRPDPVSCSDQHPTHAPQFIQKSILEQRPAKSVELSSRHRNDYSVEASLEARPTPTDPTHAPHVIQKSILEPRPAKSVELSSRHRNDYSIEARPETRPTPTDPSHAPQPYLAGFLTWAGILFPKLPRNNQVSESRARPQNIVEVEFVPLPQIQA
jgi:hypothetical protein